jgi:hypothetical protein
MRDAVETFQPDADFALNECNVRAFRITLKLCVLEFVVLLFGGAHKEVSAFFLKKLRLPTTGMAGSE